MLCPSKSNQRNDNFFRFFICISLSRQRNIIQYCVNLAIKHEITLSLLHMINITNTHIKISLSLSSLHHCVNHKSYHLLALLIAQHIIEFLMYHVVNGSYFSQDLRDGQQLSSILDMKPIQVGVRVDGCSRKYQHNNTNFIISLARSQIHLEKNSATSLQQLN